MDRTPEMQNFIDNFSAIHFGKSLTECQAEGICVTCKGSAKEFRDELSRKEYGISGTCQECQDKIFGSEGG